MFHTVVTIFLLKDRFGFLRDVLHDGLVTIMDRLRVIFLQTIRRPFLRF